MTAVATLILPYSMYSVLMLRCLACMNKQSCMNEVLQMLSWIAHVQKKCLARDRQGAMVELFVSFQLSEFALPKRMQMVIWHLAQGGKGGTALSFVQCSFLSLPFHPDSKLESGA